MEEDSAYPLLAHERWEGRLYEALQRACKFIADTRGDCPFGVTGSEYATCEDCTNEGDVCWQLHFLGELREVD